MHYVKFQSITGKIFFSAICNKNFKFSGHSYFQKINRKIVKNNKNYQIFYFLTQVTLVYLI